MYLIKRVTTTPGSPIQIYIQQNQGDGDAGLAAGGSFPFYPAGSEEGPSSHQVSEYAARAIMDDPGIAQHFECSPELPSQNRSPTGPVADQDTKSRRGRGRVAEDSEQG